MLIVQSCSYIEDGDGYYRESQPSRLLGQLPDVHFVDCHIHHRLFPRLAEEADLLLLFFFHSYDLFPLIERRRKKGKVTVLETNDYYTDLPFWSPIWHYWLDPDVIVEHERMVASVDGVQTSTKRLAGHLLRLAKHVAVFPNQLADIPQLDLRKERSVPRLGWAGSQSHAADFQYAGRVLEHWLRAHPEIEFHVLSGDEVFHLLNLPGSQYKYTPPGAIADYYRFLSTIDIAVAPLLPSEYNLCRSDVKFLEYAAHGVVGIYSSPGPYDETVVHGETGMLYRSNDELIACIEKLYSDQELVSKIRENAYRYVEQNRRAEAHVEERLKYYRELFSRVPDGGYHSSAPDYIQNLAARSGNYYRIEIDEVGLKLTSASNKATSPELLAEVEVLLEKYPDALSLLQMAGRICDDLRQPDRAAGFLARALALDGENSRTLSEMARSRVLVGDTQGAKAILNGVLRLNPWYVPGWMFALNLLRAVPEGDPAQIIQSLLQAHPRSYRLLLLASELLQGPGRIEYLLQVLPRLVSQLDGDRLFTAQPVFVGSVDRAVKQCADVQRNIALLHLASRFFPHSAKLCAELASQLRIAGKHEDADKGQLKALQMCKYYESYAREYKGDTQTHRAWRTAEAVERYLRKRSE